MRWETFNFLFVMLLTFSPWIYVCACSYKPMLGFSHDFQISWNTRFLFFGGRVGNLSQSTSNSRHVCSSGFKKCLGIRTVAVITLVMWCYMHITFKFVFPSQVWRLQKTCSIALVGKYTKLRDCYASVFKALEHSALAINHKLNLMVSPCWSSACFSHLLWNLVLCRGRLCWRTPKFSDSSGLRGLSIQLYSWV